MKKILFAALISFISLAGFAQKAMPTLKVGSVAKAQLTFSGRDIDCTVTLKSIGDVINIDWDVVATGGTFAMKAKGLESGTKFFSGQPTPDDVTNLTDAETFMCISKTAYQSLVKSKSFVYGGLTYTVKDMPDGFKLDGQAVDATYVATADGKTSIWVLNNPDYPMALAFKGNPTGADYTILSIK